MIKSLEHWKDVIMNLAIDIGNTRTKLGLFDQDELVHFEIWERWTKDQLASWSTNFFIENVILSTVRGEAPEGVEYDLQERYPYLRLETDTPLPFRNAYRTPQTLGKDRLAAVAGAFHLYPGRHCLVIDAGTCITYDVLDAGGTYRGGNIAPGLRMRLQAMHAFTARLPLVEPEDTPYWLGDSTETALRNGAQWGAALEMEGVIDRFRAEKGGINVILTGGDTDFLVKKLKSEIFVHHHLVLCGLNKILTYNVERLE